MIERCVITNLDTNSVTWSSPFCNEAKKNGWSIGTTPLSDHEARLFLGDDIPNGALTPFGVNIYLLGAFEGLSIELDNITKCDLTLLASRSELEKIKHFVPSAIQRKLLVNGFPIDTQHLQSLKVPFYDKQSYSVCFLGETRPEKNPELEVLMAKRLTDEGFTCTHMSPFAVSFRDELEKVGVRVLEYMKHPAYFHHLKQQQFVVNTSFRESLWISGIESALLGGIPIVPNHGNSGLNEWCQSKLQYDYSNPVDSVLRKVSNYGSGDEIPVNQLFWFDSYQYFSRIEHVISRIMKEKHHA